VLAEGNWAAIAPSFWPGIVSLGVIRGPQPLIGFDGGWIDGVVDYRCRMFNVVK